MTLADWQTCTDPGKMLAYLSGKASERKLRLFACACCRRIWNLLHEEGSRQAVETAERFADGLASADELAQAKVRAKKVTWSAIQRAHSEWTAPRVTDMARAAWVAVWVACAAEETSEANVWNNWSTTAPYEVSHGQSLAERTAQVTSWAKTVAEEQGIWAAFAKLKAEPAEEQSWQGPDEEEACQCIILRDIFGHVEYPQAIQALWRRWQDSTVMKMADVIHQHRRFEDLPILADALEEAGCDHQAVLEHCRTPGPHMRGCWVLDAILERN
jgi:hypothetical protein